MLELRRRDAGAAGRLLRCTGPTAEPAAAQAATQAASAGRGPGTVRRSIGRVASLRHSIEAP